VQEDKLLTTHAIKIVRETKARRKAMISQKKSTAILTQSPRKKAEQDKKNS
jgi:hypothetical protein